MVLLQPLPLLLPARLPPQLLLLQLPLPAQLLLPAQLPLVLRLLRVLHGEGGDGDVRK